MTDKNMSHTIPCAIAFGAASASLLGCTSSDSPKHGTIPILHTHGRNDGLVNFSQAAAERDAVVVAWYPGVTPEVVTKADDYEWDRYTNDHCTVFEFVQHDWACGFVLPLGASMIPLKGHCFPGSNQFLGCDRRHERERRRRHRLSVRLGRNRAAILHQSSEGRLIPSARPYSFGVVGRGYATSANPCLRLLVGGGVNDSLC